MMICGYCNQAGCEEGICREGTCLECGKEVDEGEELCSACEESK